MRLAFPRLLLGKKTRTAPTCARALRTCGPWIVRSEEGRTSSSSSIPILVSWEYSQIFFSERAKQLQVNILKVKSVCLHNTIRVSDRLAYAKKKKKRQKQKNQEKEKDYYDDNRNSNQREGAEPHEYSQIIRFRKEIASQLALILPLGHMQQFQHYCVMVYLSHAQ